MEKKPMVLVTGGSGFIASYCIIALLKKGFAVRASLRSLYPLWLRIIPGWACSMEEAGHAMIRCATSGYSKPILEVADIKIQARA